MRVVAFTGMPGAGKTEAVDVARERGLPIVRMGDLVREEAQRQGLGASDEAVGALATSVREREGMDAWARRTAERVRRDHGNTPMLIVDGVRNWEEVVRLRQDLGHDFHLVAVTAAPDDRLSRLQARGRADDPRDAGQAEVRDQREMRWGIARAIALADTVLTNEGRLDEFKGRVAAFFDGFTA